jgi:hypothetical protein
MYYKLLLLINFLGVLLANFLFPGDVKINVSAPGSVEAGQEIVVDVTLNKSDLNSFARLQHDLPGGITAEVIKSGNAEFTFENQKAKFIWLKLPPKEVINISYKLKINERLKGDFDLIGSFAYIADNERKSLTLEQKPISITPSPSIDPSLIVDVDQFKPMAKPPAAKDQMKQVLCIRQKPYKAEAGDEYIVNLLVNKGNKEKFAKIQETVPEGFKAVSMDEKEAIFTFKNQTAKFLWMTLPSESFFVVSYKLIPKETGGTPGKIQGKFSYIQEEKTRNIDIIQQDVNLNNTEKSHLASIIKNVSTPEISNKEGIFTESKEIEDAKSYSDLKKHKGKVRIEIAEEAQKILEQNSQLTNKLEPQSGVYYRVQVAAGHRPINVERYFNKYNIDKEVRTEIHEGWRKYSVGSFPVYKEARDYRVHIWNTTSIDDAFVAAYNSGERITVQEALMITNHKWYR